MKQLISITYTLLVSICFVSCGGASGENPGRIYMPDMAYSRAYETYGHNNINDYENLRNSGVNFTGLPVAGTMARGDVSTYPYPGNDSGYALSVNYRNPFDTLTLSKAQLTEAERLYLINCGICHGTKLDGNGPLWNGGNGPFPALPRNLLDDYSKALADGQYYHVITYGKGQMGSYAAQVKPEQRWWIINYIRGKQSGAGSTSDSATKAATDTTKASGTNIPGTNK
ncbi:MAG: cytochrome c [Chitinophagaceae bacterium]